MNCPHCTKEIANDSRFCKHCGKEIITQKKPTYQCPNCRTYNSEQALFCISCGYRLRSFRQHPPKYAPRFPLDLASRTTMEASIKTHFFKTLREQLIRYFPKANYEDFLEQFYKGFHEVYDLRIQQLALDVQSILARQNETVQPEIDFLLDKHFHDLIDYYFIIHCKSIIPVKLPESILRHANTSKQNLVIHELILDYLDLQSEPETYYTNFLEMPPQKFKNTTTAFLFPHQSERIIVIGDQTLFGSNKEGFAFTEKGLYWKAHFNKARRVYFDDLKTLERNKDWLSINGYYFHVNPSVNLKVLMLLEKLKRIL